MRSQEALGEIAPPRPQESKTDKAKMPQALFEHLVYPKMHLRSGLCLEPRWGSLQRSPRLVIGGEGARCPSPQTPIQLSAFGLGFWPFGPQQCHPKTNYWLCLHACLIYLQYLLLTTVTRWCSGRVSDSRSADRWFNSRRAALSGNDLGQVVHTNVPLFTKQYKLVPCEGFHVNMPYVAAMAWVQ